MSSHNKQAAVFVLAAEEGIRAYVFGLCERNNYHAVITVDLEELVRRTKDLSSAIVLVDSSVVNLYGARIYSRINVACPGCSVILLCDQANRGRIKEAMELGVYACILSPYEEWELLTLIKNILATKKPRGRKRSKRGQQQ